MEYIKDFKTKEEFWNKTNVSRYLLWYAVIYDIDILPLLRTMVDGPCIQAITDGVAVTHKILSKSMKNNKLDFCVGMMYNDERIRFKAGIAVEIIGNIDCDIIRENITI